MRKHILAAAMLAAAAPLAMAQAPAAEVAAYDAAEGQKAVAALADAIEARFVLPDVAKRYAAALRTKLAAGGYDRATDARAFALAVTADLQAVASDGHLAMFAPAPPQPAPLVAGQAATPAPPAPPPSMEQAGWIVPGIAFVRFNDFFAFPETLKAFTAFLDAHAGAKVLIIDARTHRGGGLEEMDILSPRIFTRAQTVMVMDTRASVAEARGPQPFNSLVRVAAPPEFSRSEHRVRPVRPVGPWAKTKIYYLISDRTGSAAEHLAAVFKGTKRATLIGEATYGAGNYGAQVPLGGGYSAFIPYGRSYFPGDTGWEGTGVAPDIRIAPERALVEALIREGIAPAEAEALSVKYMPKQPMRGPTPRRP